jgi:hypothetical protein
MAHVIETDLRSTNGILIILRKEFCEKYTFALYSIVNKFEKHGMRNRIGTVDNANSTSTGTGNYQMNGNIIQALLQV